MADCGEETQESIHAELADAQPLNQEIFEGVKEIPDLLTKVRETIDETLTKMDVSFSAEGLPCPWSPLTSRGCACLTLKILRASPTHPRTISADGRGQVLANPPSQPRLCLRSPSSCMPRTRHEPLAGPALRGAPTPPVWSLLVSDWIPFWEREQGSRLAPTLCAVRTERGMQSVRRQAAAD